MTETVDENREIPAQFLSSKAKTFGRASVFAGFLDGKCSWPSLTVGLLTLHDSALPYGWATDIAVIANT